MGTVAVVVDRHACPSIAPSACADLRDLGVTHVTMLADEREIVIVLDGWAFDGHANASRVTDALGCDPGAARIFHVVSQTTVGAPP